MPAINRVDQAILLLKERLQRLQTGVPGKSAKAGTAAKADGDDPLVPLRHLVRQGRIADRDLRKALVRSLLADSLGDELVGSLEFQSVAEQVSAILESSPDGRALLSRALSELD